MLKREVGTAEQAKGLWQEVHDLYVTLTATAGVAESAARLGLLARSQGEDQRRKVTAELDG